MKSMIKKRLLAVGLSLVICTGSLTGCGSNTKLVFTSGLSGNQLFKIGSTSCTMPEIMIYLTTFYNEYAKAYGEEMWKYDFGGLSLEEHVKDIVISKMAQIKTMILMAKEYGITLSAEERERISVAAQEYYNRLPEKLIKTENITLDVITKVYEEYTLANKVYMHITEAADMEISDDEARAVTVQQIFFEKPEFIEGSESAAGENELMAVRNKAEAALERLRQGEKFEVVAAEYNDETPLVQSYGRGMTEAVFENVLFSLDEEELSDMIETKEGFYIVKCISTMDYEATQANKLVLAEQRKKEAFSKAYTEIATNTHSQFRDRIWEKITLDKEIHSADANFFEIYEEYVKQ